MAYTKVFTKPYASGYKDLPSQTTPITATTLNAKDTAITHIEEYLEDNPIGSDVEWNQITESGTKIAEITIGEEVTEVYAPTGGSGGTTVVANPTLVGTEDSLEGLQVGDTKYKVAGGSGNANIWYGTHAEYEAQSSTIADDTQVCFTDDVGLEAGSEYYSETEQIIGTYMGKPLYRKIYHTSKTIHCIADTWVDSGITINDAKLKNGYICTDSSNGKWAINIAINNQTGMLRFKLFNDGDVLTNYDIIVEYVKTTDSPVGVINGIRNGDNYSTTEQVIGTWLGKPLYRKLFQTTLADCVTNGTGVARQIDVTSLNIDDCPRNDVYVKAIAYSGTLPYFAGDNPQRYVRAYMSRVNGVADHVNIMNANTGYNGQSATLILEYTKTTD